MKTLYSPPFPIRLIVALGAGVSLALAFAPFSLSLSGYVGITLLLVMVWGQSTGSGFVLGLIFALGYFGLGISWVFVSMHNFGNMGSGLAALATFLFVSYNSLFIGLSVALARYVKIRFGFSETVFGIFLLPIFWVWLEWLRSILFTGFPWLLLGSSQLDTPLGEFLPLAGELGASWLMLITCGLAVFFVICTKFKTKIYALSGIVIIWGSGFGLSHINWTQKQTDTLDVALVQGSIPIRFKWDDSFLHKTLDTYMRYSKEALPADLIIWPETAITATFNNVTDTVIPKLRNFLQNNNSSLISGIVFRNTAGFLHNSLIAVNAEQTSFYHKRHLVPFGEYVPLINGIVGFIMREFSIPMSDFRPGKTRQKNFVLQQKAIGASICYEAAYSGLIRENSANTSILLTVSNDSWFGNSAARYQHLDIARVRAKENSKYLLRATNDGITAVIDNKGNVVNSAAQNIKTFIKTKVPAFIGSTLFARYGNLPFFVLSAAIIFGLFLARNESVQQ